MFFLNSDILKKYENDILFLDSPKNDSFDFFYFSKKEKPCLVICPYALSHVSSDGLQINKQNYIGTFSSVFSDCLSYSLLRPNKSFHHNSFLEFFSLHTDALTKNFNFDYIIEFSSFNNQPYDYLIEHSFDIETDFLSPLVYKKIQSPYKNTESFYLKINLNEKTIDINNSNQFNRTLNMMIDIVTSIVV